MSLSFLSWLQYLLTQLFVFFCPSLKNIRIGLVCWRLSCKTSVWRFTQFLVWYCMCVCVCLYMSWCVCTHGFVPLHVNKAYRYSCQLAVLIQAQGQKLEYPPWLAVSIYLHLSICLPLLSSSLRPHLPLYFLCLYVHLVIRLSVSLCSVTANSARKLMRSIFIEDHLFLQRELVAQTERKLQLQILFTALLIIFNGPQRSGTNLNVHVVPMSQYLCTSKQQND